VKYATIKAHEAEFRVRLMCRVLDVSSGGYYAWRSRTPSEQAQARAALDATVREEFKRRKGRAGAPRLSRHLGRGRRQVAQSLRRQGLRAKAARKFKATTNSNHSLPVAENLLQQDFTAQRPNQVWVGDITYIATDEGWLYLAVVMDLFSRKVVGWSMSDRMTATLVCDALRMALFRRKRPRGVIMHTDRGSQYCSREPGTRPHGQAPIPGGFQR
jgi:transposase InsO family protein